MTEHATEQLRSEDDSGEADLVVLFELVADACGELAPHDAARIAVTEAGHEHPGTWRDTWESRLTSAGARLGMTAIPFDLDPAGIARSNEWPLATCLATDDAPPRWVLVLARRGSQVRVVEPASDAAGGEWMSAAKLARRLGPAARRWLAVEAAAPMSALAGTVEYRTHEVPHTDAHAHHPSPWERLRGLVRLERSDLSVVIIYAVGAGLLSLATPIAAQSIVNTVAFGTLMQPLVVLAVAVLVFLTAAGTLSVLQRSVVETLQQRLFVRVVADLAYRLPRARLESLEASNGPALVNRFFDIVTVQKSVATMLLDAVGVVLTSAIGMLVLAFYHPVLVGFDAVLVVSLVVIVFVLGRGALATAIGESVQKHRVAEWLEDLARSPVAFKSPGGPKLAAERTDEIARAYLRERRAHWRILLRQIVGTLVLQALASALLLGVGGYLVIDRQLTLGQLVAAELIVTKVVDSFAKLGKYFETFYDLLAALDKIGYLVDLPLERRDGEERPRRAGPASVRLLGVSVEGSGGGHALTKARLHLEAGERIALVGRSGSGKSTLLDVLGGLRGVSSGRLELDGVDVRNLSLQSHRRDVVIARTEDLVAGTIADNVRMGAPHLDATHIRQALEEAGLREEVDELPLGLATHVSPSGSPLSRGQRARLVLARAIAARPRVLVLDGCLDDVDGARRFELLERLSAPGAPWTLIVATHEAQLMTRLGRVIECRDGRLVEAS